MAIQVPGVASISDFDAELKGAIAQSNNAQRLLETAMSSIFQGIALSQQSKATQSRLGLAKQQLEASTALAKSAQALQERGVAIDEADAARRGVQDRALEALGPLLQRRAAAGPLTPDAIDQAVSDLTLQDPRAGVAARAALGEVRGQEAVTELTGARTTDIESQTTTRKELLGPTKRAAEADAVLKESDARDALAREGAQGRFQTFLQGVPHAFTPEERQTRAFEALSAADPFAASLVQQDLAKGDLASIGVEAARADVDTERARAATLTGAEERAEAAAPGQRELTAAKTEEARAGATFVQEKALTEQEERTLKKTQIEILQMRIEESETGLRSPQAQQAVAAQAPAIVEALTNSTKFITENLSEFERPGSGKAGPRLGTTSDLGFVMRRGNFAVVEKVLESTKRTSTMKSDHIDLAALKLFRGDLLNGSRLFAVEDGQVVLRDLGDPLFGEFGSSATPEDAAAFQRLLEIFDIAPESLLPQSTGPRLKPRRAQGAKIRSGSSLPQPSGK